jgi:nitrite reductase (NADH) large subunit
MKRVVVIGAGPAGARCAERLAERGMDLSVTLIGDEPDLPYNRVALSKWLAGDIDADALITHPSARLASLGITYRPGLTITGIDRHGREVSAAGETLAYDALVLALGAEAVRLPFPGANLPGVELYRTIADVRRMIGKAAGGGNAVVIGGGLLGLEAAVGLARHGMKVTVLQAVDRLMNRQLDKAAAALLTRRLENQGISVVLDAVTEAVEGSASVTGVRLAGGRVIPAEMLVMAVGIRPRAALGRAAGLTVNRGIVVNEAMRSSDPAIYAIGECAEHGGMCCGLVAPALEQAETAARAILGEPAQYRPPADAATLKIAGAGVWSAGDVEAAGENIVLEDHGAGSYRMLRLRDNRLVTAVLYGETGDAPWYLDLLTSGTDVGPMRELLAFGSAFFPAEAAA